MRKINEKIFKVAHGDIITDNKNIVQDEAVGLVNVTQLVTDNYMGSDASSATEETAKVAAEKLKEDYDEVYGKKTPTNISRTKPVTKKVVTGSGSRKVTVKRKPSARTSKNTKKTQEKQSNSKLLLVLIVILGAVGVALYLNGWEI